MRIALVPVLFATMVTWSSSFSEEDGEDDGEIKRTTTEYYDGSLAVALSLFCGGIVASTKPSLTTRSTGLAATVLLLFLLYYRGFDDVPGSSTVESVSHVLLLLFLLLVPLYKSIRWFPGLHGVLTHGEWTVATSIAAIVVVKWGLAMTATIHTTDPSMLRQQHNLYRYVAISGIVGCGAACASIGSIEPRLRRLVVWRTGTHPLKDASLLILLLRIAFIAAAFLAFVEATLFKWHSPPQQMGTYVPKSIMWLVSFLLDKEEEPILVARGVIPVSWRRLDWLAYWVFVLAITIPLAPVASGSNALTATRTGATTRSTVVTRKWFHFVACVLFVPTTIAAPQLQSLSYAIALALLCILECIRHDVEWLNRFYHRYLDESKDAVVRVATAFATNGDNKKADDGRNTAVITSGVVIVSHMALIAGCAAPLWISEYVGIPHDDPTNLLLRMWGILCLGIGDAMGAVVGKYCGRFRWGIGQRTVEGSTAMLVSMALLCYSILGGLRNINLWLPAVIFTTVLEAFTVQIDNIVLPLAGSAVILVSRGSVRPLPL